MGLAQVVSLLLVRMEEPSERMFLILLALQPWSCICATTFHYVPRQPVGLTGFMATLRRRPVKVF